MKLYEKLNEKNNCDKTLNEWIDTLCDLGMFVCKNEEKLSNYFKDEEIISLYAERNSLLDCNCNYLDCIGCIRTSLEKEIKEINGKN